MKTEKTHEPLSSSQRAAAADALNCLRGGAALRIEGQASSYVVPDFVARRVVALLEAFAEGQTPLVSTMEEEVGTQEAAVFLKVSRPTVVKMMDDGRIPFRQPRKHRRVRVADLVAFESRLAHDRQAAVNELAALGQEMISQARKDGSFSDEMM